MKKKSVFYTLSVVFTKIALFYIHYIRRILILFR